jgi:hypothetical protein
MPMNYTPIPNEFLEEMGELSDAEYGRLIRWCQTYSITGESLELRGNERFYRRRCQMQMDKYRDHYAEIAKKRSESGRIGGQANASKCKQMQANGSKRKETKTNTKTDRDTPPPNGGRSDPPLYPPGGFDAFWAAYPRKVGKEAARRAFAKARTDLDTLLAAIERQRGSAQWQKDGGQYIPNPATWLQQGRWEDELSPAQGPRRRKSWAELAEELDKEGL